MKAAIYCRVDQGGTVETQYDALEAQRIRLEQYALHHNIQIAGYYEDRGCPGHLTERPGLMRLINDCLEGLFDTVLVVIMTGFIGGTDTDHLNGHSKFGRSINHSGI